MAHGKVRREAYTAGGEASQLSLDTSNFGAFIFRSVGVAPEAPPRRGATGRPGAENDAKRRDGSPGMLGDASTRIAVPEIALPTNLSSKPNRKREQRLASGPCPTGRTVLVPICSIRLPASAAVRDATISILPDI